MEVQQLLKQAEDNKKENQKFLKYLKTKNSRKLDDAIHRVHDDVFDEINCLECANCCKTTSPIFYQKDIERIAKHLRMKAVDFENEYLRIDEDKDWVLQQAPCPFLGEENYCNIYDVRPNACKEYPHTDRKNFYQITELTYKNTFVCPAVNIILEKLKTVKV